MKRKNIFYWVIFILFMIAIIFFSEFIISSNKNGKFYDKFASIKQGMKQKNVITILGAPHNDIEPMSSLIFFWGNKELKKTVATPSTTFTYKSRGWFYFFTKMRRPIFQIGFNEQGEATCKHHY